MAKRYQITLSDEALQSLKEYQKRAGSVSVADAVRDLVSKGLWLEQTLRQEKSVLILEEDGVQHRLKLIK